MDGHLQKRRVLFSVCVCVSLEISQLITRTTNDKQERHQWHWMAVADVPCPPKTEGASKQQQAGRHILHFTIHLYLVYIIPVRVHSSGQ